MSALPLTMIEYQNLERAKILMPTSANRDEEWWERGEGGAENIAIAAENIANFAARNYFCQIIPLG